MSVLTKIFVALLVVLSLLLSAATLTFVNTVEADRLAARATEQQLRSQVASAAADKARAENLLAAGRDAAAALEGQIASLRQQVGTLEKDLATRASDLAKAQLETTMVNADKNRLTAAVEASLASGKEKDDLIARLRSDFDSKLSEFTDLNVRFNEVTNKLDITEAQRRNLAEQLTEARSKLDRLATALRDRGVDPTRVTGGLAAGAPALNGVVRSTVNIGGVPYATITLGSEDAVQPGMEFNIVEKNSARFLGKLTIVEVQPNEAIGRIVAPDTSAVIAGVIVRTQL